MGDWVDIGKSWEDFLHHPMRKVGVLIEVQIGKTKKQYLIGDINKWGGICDDCTAFDEEDRVIRAKVVWE